MILITGAAGFIGFHVARRLLRDGHTVVGLDNLNEYYDPALKEARLRLLTVHPRFTFHRVNIADEALIAGIFTSHEPEFVIHLAAQAGVRHSLTHPRSYIESNVTGFLNILEGSRLTYVKHLVYASSSSVYGLNTKMPFSVRDNVDHPISLYGATKKTNELMAHAYSYLYSLPVTGLRFFTVYGPWGRPDMAYFSFTKSILAGLPIDVYNEGKMKRDFTFVDDIVEGILRVLVRPATPDLSWRSDKPASDSSTAPYRIYNIGGHSPVELLRFIETIEDCLEIKAVKRFLPAQPGDMLATEADLTELIRDVGLEPRTPIEVGLRRFVDWYRTYYRFTAPSSAPY